MAGLESETSAHIPYGEGIYKITGNFRTSHSKMPYGFISVPSIHLDGTDTGCDKK